MHACKYGSIFRLGFTRRLPKVIRFSAFWSRIIIWSFLRRFSCACSIALSGFWTALAFATVTAAKKSAYSHFSSPSPLFLTFEKLTAIIFLFFPRRFVTREWAHELSTTLSTWRLTDERFNSALCSVINVMNNSSNVIWNK